MFGQIAANQAGHSRDEGSSCHGFLSLFVDVDETVHCFLLSRVGRAHHVTASCGGHSPPYTFQAKPVAAGGKGRRRHFPAARSRSTITATLPSMPRPAFSDCSPALIASTVQSMVWLTCGTTSPCVTHSIARVIPRWRNARASLSSVAGFCQKPSRFTI